MKAILNMNKEELQKCILTRASECSNVYEGKIICEMVDVVQKELSGKQTNGKVTSSDKFITISLLEMVKAAGDSSYEKVVESLYNLRKWTFEYDNEKRWKVIGFIESFRITEDETNVTVEVPKKVWEALSGFTKGNGHD